ncbi:hypothetical protein ACFQ6N_09340 [Kitasatospora sp. NPDC056446]|uniref:hypothetical protein n=1 Tax=Kitasatospora sp. NPDC056446 TaxID=3345819 RepID=UPI003678F7CE
MIEELAEHPYRVPAPTPGVDLGTVLKECFAARRQAVGRAVLVLLAAGAVPAVVVLDLLSLSASEPVSGPDAGSRAVGLLVRVGLAYLGIPLVFVAAWLARSDRPGRRRLGTWLAVGCALVAGQVLGWAFVGGLLAVWFLVALAGRVRLERTLHDLGAGRAAVPEDPVRQEVYHRLAWQQAYPDVVYSDYAPFVGAGVQLDHWSFADELLPDPAAAPAADPTPVLTVPVVHARLRAELARLGAASVPAYPGDRLHGITVDDLVFKSGKRLGPATDWCGYGPGTAFAALAPYAERSVTRPVPGTGSPGTGSPGTGSPGTGSAGPAPAGPAGAPYGAAHWWADSVDLAAEERLRHYLAVRVEGWNAEVVVTVYVRAQLQGGQLFLESRAFVLPPVARAYHAIDTAAPPVDAGDWFGLAAAALASLPVLVAGSAGVLRRAARSRRAEVRNARRYVRMCRENRPVDHGPALSVRELGAEAAYQQLFQEMDVQRFVKAVRARIVSAVRDCLRDHGFRTDGAEVLQNVVINSGVQVHGDVHGVVQSGAAASASYRTVTPPAQRVGSGPQQD